MGLINKTFYLLCALSSPQQSLHLDQPKKSTISTLRTTISANFARLSLITQRMTNTNNCSNFTINSQHSLIESTSTIPCAPRSLIITTQLEPAEEWSSAKTQTFSNSSEKRCQSISKSTLTDLTPTGLQELTRSLKEPRSKSSRLSWEPSLTQTGLSIFQKSTVLPSVMPLFQRTSIPVPTGQSARTSSITFVISRTADPAGLTEPPRPLMIVHALPQRDRSQNFIQLLTPLAAVTSCTASLWDAVVVRLVALGNGLRTLESSVEETSGMASFASTTLWKSVLTTLNLRFSRIVRLLIRCSQSANPLARPTAASTTQVTRTTLLLPMASE